MMMMRNYSRRIYPTLWALALLLLVEPYDAFVVFPGTTITTTKSQHDDAAKISSFRRTPHDQQPAARTTTTRREMMVLPEAANSLLVATIDSDIANIPENEFAPIFMGGLIVMFGGLFSALAVGLIVDQKDLYANIVADSYAQSAEDEEFWKGLSEEEKKKTRELLDRMKNKDDRQGAQALETMMGSSSSSSDEETSSAKKPVVAAVESEKPKEEKKKKEIGMFSDYGDD